MVQIVAATCPRCGAGIDVPSDLRKAHCVYCGASIIIGANGSQKTECRICDGYGRLEICRVCNGSGGCGWIMHVDRVLDVHRATFITKGDAHCDRGRCSACEGTGKSTANTPCVYCNGSGMCPKCHGTGHCPACRGVGSTPNPRGSQVCYLCHGNGMVDIKRADLRWGDRCSVCKMSLISDGNFCPHCGKGNKCPRCGKDWGSSGRMCESCGFECGTKP